MKRQWSVCQHCPELSKKYGNGFMCFYGKENEYMTPEDFFRRTKVPANCVRRMEQIVMGQRSIQQ